MSHKPSGRREQRQFRRSARLLDMDDRQRACAGKVRYARKMRTKGNVHCYRCDYCGGWHIGHKRRPWADD